MQDFANTILDIDLQDFHLIYVLDRYALIEHLTEQCTSLTPPKVLQGSLFLSEAIFLILLYR